MTSERNTPGENTSEKKKGIRWYLLKTWTGQEENLAAEIRRLVPSRLYEDVFVLYGERLWRRQGRSILHRELLFPGRLFLTCRETESLCVYIRQSPALAGLLASGHVSMFPMTENDAEFLERVAGKEHVIRLSGVLRKKDGTYTVSGPLEQCLDGVERVEFRKRFAKTRRRLWGEEMVIPLGIVTEEDLAQGTGGG